MSSLFNEVRSFLKSAKGRCWEGYEPVPGKEPYSDDSCRPVSSKKKKKSEKKKKSMTSTEKVATSRFLMNAAKKRVANLSPQIPQQATAAMNPKFSIRELERILPLIQKLRTGKGTQALS